MQRLKLIATCAAAVALATCGTITPGNCDSLPIGIPQLMSGKDIPLVLTLKDLNADWRAVSLTDQGGSSYLSLIMGMAGESATYYTKGDTVTIGGDVYLIAYHRQSKKIDFMSMMRNSGNPPKPEPLTADTSLELSVLNLHATSGLFGIHPFDIQKEIASSTEAIEAAIGENTSNQSAQNIRQLAYGMIQYVQDNEETWPDMKDPAAVKKLIYPYVKNDKIFVQPGTDVMYLPNPILSKHTLAQIPDPTTMVMFYESQPAKDGSRVAAFADGHTSKISAADWPAVKKASKIP